MKTLNKILSLLVSGFICLACFPFYISPVYADTVTYYSYDNAVAGNEGSPIWGINLNVSKVNAVILNKNVSNTRSYQVAYFIYAYGSTKAEAFTNLNAQFNSNSSSENTSLFKGIFKYNNGNGWTNGNSINSYSNWGSIYDGHTENFVAFYSIVINPNNSWWSSCYGRKGTVVISCNSDTPLYSEYILAYIKKVLINLDDTRFTLSSWLGGWISDSTAITPVITPESDGTEGEVDNLPTPEPTPIPSTEPTATPIVTSSPDTPSSLSQWQSITIQEGAFAFTVEEGAIQNSNTIEENAVNVTVNNNNSLNNENIQNLNNLINNVVDTGSQNAINEGINAITGFTAIARSFSGLMAAVLGFLPGWVTTLLALLFVLLFVMIVFRLIHLFI